MRCHVNDCVERSGHCQVWYKLIAPQPDENEWRARMPTISPVLLAFTEIVLDARRRCLTARYTSACRHTTALGVLFRNRDSLPLCYASGTHVDNRDAKVHIPRRQQRFDGKRRYAVSTPCEATITGAMYLSEDINNVSKSHKPRTLVRRSVSRLHLHTPCIFRSHLSQRHYASSLSSIFSGLHNYRALRGKKEIKDRAARTLNVW